MIRAVVIGQSTATKRRMCPYCLELRAPAVFRYGNRRCLPCRTALHRQWVANNRDRARELNDRYRANHPELDRVRYRNKYRQFPEYNAWKHMHSRCNNPRVPSYKNYGARGIRLCDAWSGPGGFERFLSHAGRRPTSQHSIDRIDVNGHYEPGNVRWATSIEQSQNRRNNHHIRIGSLSLCLSEAARVFKVREPALRKRLKNGLPAWRAILEPYRAQERFISVGGERLTLTGWSRRLGGCANVVSRRIHDGWGEQDAATAPLGMTRKKWHGGTR